MTISIACKRRRDMMRIRVGLRDVFALDIESLEAAVEGRIEHVGDAQAGLGVERDVPFVLEIGAQLGIGNVPIAGQLMRK